VPLVVKRIQIFEPHIIFTGIGDLKFMEYQQTPGKNCGFRQLKKTGLTGRMFIKGMGRQ